MPIARIPTPYHLFSETVTITPPGFSQEDSGGTVVTHASGSVTVMGSLQPGSSREAVNHAMVMATTTYDLYLAPDTTSGVALSFTDTQWKASVVAINGKTYRSVGAALDPVSNGCLLHLVLERWDGGQG